MRSILLAIMLVLGSACYGQKLTEVINLWPNGAPTSNFITAAETDHGKYVDNVTKPVLTVYVPENPSGIAILALPGGGYVNVWQGTEGHNRKDWYMKNGITYAVLKYRLPNMHKEVPLDDVQEAMRILKSDSKKYCFSKLGVQGCSAGGHLAATASTYYTGKENRPDFQILFYPVISFDKNVLENVSIEDLPDDQTKNVAIMIQGYRCDMKADSNTPPALIMASTDDSLVDVQNSINYYNALRKSNVQAALCLFPTGSHGWYGNESFEYESQWMDLMMQWIKQLKF